MSLNDKRPLIKGAYHATGIVLWPPESSTRIGRTQCHIWPAIWLIDGVGQKLAEHGFVIVSVVPLPHPLVEVGTEPSRGDGVMGSANVRLEVTEEPFDGVGVDVAADVDPLRVANPAMLVVARDGVVRAVFVREDHRPRQDELMELRADAVRIE